MSAQRGYKRSWRNLLINKRYQLRFTLFMAGLAAVLMTLLGWWVTRVAGEATNVAKSRQRGRICATVPDEKPAEAAKPPTPVPPVPDPVDPDVKVDVGEMQEEAPEHHRGVVLDESSMRIDPDVAPVTPPTVPTMSAEERAKLIAERDE